MAGSGSPQPKRPNPPREEQQDMRKPLQVMHISRKQDLDTPNKDSKEIVGEVNELKEEGIETETIPWICLLYTSPSPRDATLSRMPACA